MNTPRMVFLGGSDLAPGAWDSVRQALDADPDTASVELDWTAAPWERGPEAALDSLAALIGTGSGPTLVAHSLAGLFLPALADRVGAAAEIYVAALTPTPGRSMAERLFDGDDVFDADWLEASLGGTPPPDARERHLFHDGAPDDAHRFRPFPLPLEPFFTTAFVPAPLAPRWRGYAVAGKDRVLRPEWQRQAARALGADAVAELDAGHLPHLAAPRALAALLRSWSLAPMLRGNLR